METKKCTKCGEEKSLTEFRKYVKGRSYNNFCKACLASRAKTWRENNKEKVSALRKVSRAKNREKNCAVSMAWYKDNSEREIAKKKEKTSGLHGGYVAQRLGLPLAECTPELIELKREQLRIYRLTKQLKQEIKNV